MTSTPTQDLAELYDILKEKSVRFGSFTLASGQTSDVYVDCRLTTCHPKAMPLIGRLFLRKMEEKMWLPEAVGGLTMGADPITFAIGRESLDRPPVIDCFVVRKERKQHGMQRFVEGLESPEGRKGVIVEDVARPLTGVMAAVIDARAQQVVSTVKLDLIVNRDFDVRVECTDRGEAGC